MTVKIIKTGEVIDIPENSNYGERLIEQGLAVPAEEKAKGRPESNLETFGDEEISEAQPEPEKTAKAKKNKGKGSACH